MGSAEPKTTANVTGLYTAVINIYFYLDNNVTNGLMLTGIMITMMLRYLGRIVF